MRRPLLRATALLALLALGLAACGGDDDDTTAPTEAGGDGDGDGGGGPLDVDNCSLLTDEEVSGLAGEELVHGEDSPLGCPFSAEGEAVADFSILASRNDGGAAALADELAPDLNQSEILGADAEIVSLADDSGSVNFVVACRDGLCVELVTTFLDVEPGSASLRTAAELAETALGRLEAAA